ncbi:MAG: cytochrome c maturation protein CcmE [Candidatus Thorarchaeota archaeon]
MKKTKIIAIIAIIFSLSLIITLIVINVRPYLRVSQVVSNPTEYDNLEIQVIGFVEGFSGGNFNLTENGNKILVDISQITVPSELKNGIEIVVVGQFNISLILKASQILIQCS